MHSGFRWEWVLGGYKLELAIQMARPGKWHLW